LKQQACIAPSGSRYRLLLRKRLGNRNLLKLRTNSKQRAESQPSGARAVRLLMFMCF
jgi:hypothetical protein